MPEHLLICSDIFGVTAPLHALASQISKDPSGLTMLGPYAATRGSESPVFEDEAQAYSHFLTCGGLDAYVDNITNAITQISGNYSVLAFSAGASAAWLAVDKLMGTHCQQWIGFYPGQLRHQKSVASDIAGHLVLPAQETHFDVSELAQKFTRDTRVSVHRTEYAHGFMNPQSAGFDATGYTQYRDKISTWLSHFSDSGSTD